MKDFTQLPVYQRRQDILDGLKDNQVIIVESPTGSGKTTQIPLILHEAGYGNEGIIGVTQPRRIATLSVSDFIKRQIKDDQGLVGYKMRFEDTTGPTTRIKVMTDGILLMELKADPLLSSYSVMLIDEAHERSLNIDFILGLLKNIIAERPEFKVIISSATINTKVFSRF
ncbi:MAG: DEAD/DEAH box helicase, partial [Sphaerochaeta sp.]